MSKALTIREFFKQFPDDETCLSHLFNVRFGQGHKCPSCKRPSKWHRIKAERAYSCQWCGHHLHPTVGTPFAKTRTPLQVWFYAIYMFTTTRNGVAAKELQRQLGVTYKTAWLMADRIREHMANVDGDVLLGGVGQIVEIDETSIGGFGKGAGGGRYAGNKATVLGMLEKGGELVTHVVPNVKQHSLMPVVQANVLPGTNVHTDGLRSYAPLGECGYRHEKVNHSIGEYVSTTGCTVNGIESFWAQLKRSINGTYIHVSHKHLWKYAKEAEYRFNRRHTPSLMLDELLSTFRP
jgi:transposase